MKWGTVVWSSQRQRRGATEAHVRRGALLAKVLQLLHHHAAAGALPHPIPPVRVAIAGSCSAARNECSASASSRACAAVVARTSATRSGAPARHTILASSRHRNQAVSRARPNWTAGPQRPRTRRAGLGGGRVVDTHARQRRWAADMAAMNGETEEGER